MNEKKLGTLLKKCWKKDMTLMVEKTQDEHFLITNTHFAFRLPANTPALHNREVFPKLPNQPGQVYRYYNPKSYGYDEPQPERDNLISNLWNDYWNGDKELEAIHITPWVLDDEEGTGRVFFNSKGESIYIQTEYIDLLFDRYNDQNSYLYQGSKPTSPVLIESDTRIALILPLRIPPQRYQVIDAEAKQEARQTA